MKDLFPFLSQTEVYIWVYIHLFIVSYFPKPRKFSKKSVEIWYNKAVFTWKIHFLLIPDRGISMVTARIVEENKKDNFLFCSPPELFVAQLGCQQPLDWPWSSMRRMNDTWCKRSFKVLYWLSRNSCTDHHDYFASMLLYKRTVPLNDPQANWNVNKQKIG